MMRKKVNQKLIQVGDSRGVSLSSEWLKVIEDKYGTFEEVQVFYRDSSVKIIPLLHVVKVPIGRGQK